MHSEAALFDALLKLAEEQLIVLLSCGKSTIHNQLPVAFANHFTVVNHMVARLPILLGDDVGESSAGNLCSSSCERP